jgi:deoxyribodipyrimidine photolyase
MRLSRLIITALAGSLLVPALALAEDGRHSDDASPTPAASPRVEGALFCLRFADATGDLRTNTNDQFTKVQTNLTTRKQKVDSDFAELKTKLAQSRSTSDQKLTDKFADLEAKATTDTQKQAVAAFKTAVLKAVADRRATVDAANEAYHQAVLTAAGSRQTTLQTASTTYKTAVANALAAAQASCTAGVAPATVRANLKTALTNARTALEAARMNSEKVGPNLDGAKATRKAAIEKANADFKTAVQSALTTLKAALGVATSASKSPEPTASPKP